MASFHSDTASSFAKYAEAAGQNIQFPEGIWHLERNMETHWWRLLLRGFIPMTCSSVPCFPACCLVACTLLSAGCWLVEATQFICTLLLTLHIKFNSIHGTNETLGFTGVVYDSWPMLICQVSTGQMELLLDTRNTRWHLPSEQVISINEI